MSNNLLLEEIIKLKNKSRTHLGFTRPEEPGSLVLDATTSGVSESDIEVKVSYIANQIIEYRRISRYPEVEFAVEEIVTQAVVVDNEDEPIEVVFVGDYVKDNLKKKIEEAFKEILFRLSISENLYEWFRTAYIDGRLYLEKVRKNGVLKELRLINSTKIIKVVVYETQDGGKYKVKDEFYWYNPELKNYSSYAYGNMLFMSSDQWSRQQEKGRRIEVEDIIFIPFGVSDPDTGFIYSYLHQAIRPANMLMMVEDSNVVYRITRAPEKLAFYVDTGNASPDRAIQEVQRIRASFQNTIEYDPDTGKVKDNKHIQNIQKDYWLARRYGQRATEIVTISGPSNNSLADSEDIKYFQEKLYKSLKIPPSRFLDETAQVILGASNEITREELKFAKFINRLRKKFDVLFYNILYSILVEKNIVDNKDWRELKKHIRFRWKEDSYYEEAKENEILRNRLEMASMVRDDGTFPEKWIRLHILKLSESDIEELEKMKDEEEENEDDEGYGGHGGWDDDEDERPARRDEEGEKGVKKAKEEEEGTDGSEEGNKKEAEAEKEESGGRKGET